MRNPRVLCHIHGNSPSGLRPRARACIFHKTLGLMLYLLLQAELQKATSNYDLLWDHEIVYYDFDGTIEGKPMPSLQTIIRGAMDEYEKHTCLKFKLRSPTSTWITSFIRFQSYGTGCYSTSMGKKANSMQKINLASPGCATHGNALHEIGHAIGFWHEQSRPDRNNYLTVNWKNIVKDKEGDFNLRHAVDYQDEKYDYGSIMHYDLWAFSGNDKPTLTVNNWPRYKAQGSPTIGQRLHLSAGDITLVNKLYNCYNPQGYDGRLRVDVIKATGLPIETYYAEIIAYDSEGRTQIYATQDAVYTGENSWNDVFITSYRVGWRYFEIRIKNRWREVVLGHQTIWVKPPGEEFADSYCVGDKEDENRNSCVYFTYQTRTR